MRLVIDEQSIFDAATIPQAAFTVTAATDLVTSAGHGLQNGDVLQLTTATTLPAGLALVTDYYVIETTTNTFQLSATKGGSAVNITDTGTGTHTYHLKGRVLNVADYRYVSVAIATSGSGNMTAKCQGSVAKTKPDFNAAQSISNHWDYIGMVDLQSGSVVGGDTGFAVTGTDDIRLFEINANGLRWLAFNLTAWSAGKIAIKVTPFTED